MTFPIRYTGTISSRMAIQKAMGRMQNMDGDVDHPYFYVEGGVAQLYVSEDNLWEIVGPGEWVGTVDGWSGRFFRLSANLDHEEAQQASAYHSGPGRKMLSEGEKALMLAHRATKP